jgi:hypothetical protein
MSHPLDDGSELKISYEESILYLRHSVLQQA